jgi:hypothetical protein
MTQVQIDWLTLLLAPIAVVSLVLSFFATRTATRTGEPMPGWAKVVQGVGIVTVMLVALLNIQ